MSVIPLVSIIVPNFNNAIYLEQCLESLLQQTFKDFEVIVIDDCSTDHSIQVINEFLIKDLRFKLIKNQLNKGVSASRNTGLKASKGKFVTTLDSDDYYYPNKLKLEVSLLVKNPEKVGAYSSISVLYENLDIKVLSCGCVWSYKDMLLRNGNIPRDIMFRKKIIKRHGIYFNEKISLYEDWDWKIRILAYGGLIGVGNPGVIYRKTENGLSSVNKIRHLFFLTYLFTKNYKGFSFLKFPLFYLFMVYNVFRSF